MKSTPCCFCKGIVGSGNVGPSSPVVPWTCSAVISLRAMGASHPAKTGTSTLPANSQTIRVFFCVNGRGTLPATAVIPRTLISSGLPSASKIAAASSCPGSVSMMMSRAVKTGLLFACAQSVPACEACPWGRRTKARTVAGLRLLFECRLSRRNQLLRSTSTPRGGWPRASSGSHYLR